MVSSNWSIVGIFIVCPPKYSHNFNSDFYGLFMKQFGGRDASKITFEDSSIILRKDESKIINYTIL